MSTIPNPPSIKTWPLEGPPIQPSTVFILPADQPFIVQDVLSVASRAPAEVVATPLASAVPAPVAPSIRTVDTVVMPNCITFVSVGLEVRIYMNERGDLYCKQIAGPNAGKSYNLTEGKWL